MSSTIRRNDMKLDEFCTRLHTSLSAVPSNKERLETAVTFISRAFSIKPDEVAVFLLDPTGESLHFIWPRHLRDAGAVPLSAGNPLVARTAREKKGFLNNSFAVTPHASFFELFRSKEPHTLPIQKIMSAPLTREGRVTGVIQVCRKGEDVACAGADFSRNELLALEKIAATIEAFLQPD
jgi:GAF domain-containing protein